ncbi:MAG: M13 family metallopeptidase N-terminal domain-containing protein, partial [Sphingomonas bacterium]
MKRSTILLAALLATTACTPSAPTHVAGAEIGVDQAGIDKAVKPGDDFDGYASGAWRAKTEIPADRASTGIFLQVFNIAEQRNAQLIAEAAKANAAAGTDQRKIADYYNAYLDTAGIEKRGLAPIKPELDAIAAIADKAALAKALGADLRADVDPLNATNFHTEHLFGLFVTQALGDPSKEVPYLLQGGIGLPERDYYLSATPQMAQIRTAYKAYLAKIFTLAGMSDPAARADRVMALETKIATAHLDNVASQDVHKANNPWK